MTELSALAPTADPPHGVRAGRSASAAVRLRAAVIHVETRTLLPAIGRLPTATRLTGERARAVNPWSDVTMRIVVTGATGNARTALLHRLRDEPEVTSVVGVCRRPPDTKQPPYDRVHWVHLDIADPRSQPTMADAFTHADAVVHLAWRIQPSHNVQAL